MNAKTGTHTHTHTHTRIDTSGEMREKALNEINVFPFPVCNVRISMVMTVMPILFAYYGFVSELSRTLIVTQKQYQRKKTTKSKSE